MCAGQEQSPDDVCMTFGGCEMVRGRAGLTDYGSGGFAVSIGVAAGKSV
jgi:hypothetical protein